ncbi:MAG: hypothetical protein ABIR78_01275 [Ferruginibacter sp.]
MKKIILILSLLLGSLSMAFAQDDQPGGEGRIQALYVAYVTQQLKLTPEEAQKFWPLHTQFEAELKGVNKDLPELTKQQNRLDIKKKYQDGFSKIVGANRCEHFYRLGDEFRRKLLERRAQKNGNQQRPNMRRGQ